MRGSKYTALSLVACRECGWLNPYSSTQSRLARLSHAVGAFNSPNSGLATPSTIKPPILPTSGTRGDWSRAGASTNLLLRLNTRRHTQVVPQYQLKSHKVKHAKGKARIAPMSAAIIVCSVRPPSRDRRLPASPPISAAGVAVSTAASIITRKLGSSSSYGLTRTIPGKTWAQTQTNNKITAAPATQPAIG